MLIGLVDSRGSPQARIEMLARNAHARQICSESNVNEAAEAAAMPPCLPRPVLAARRHGSILF